MKAALVQCPGWGRECPPFALACLGAYLRSKGQEAACFDLNNALYHSSPALRKMWEDKDYYSFWENPSHISRLFSDNAALIDGYVDRILASGAALISFSVHTTSFLFSLAIARKIKQKDPARVVVFGGPQCSREQAAFPLAREPVVDAVVVGEGEETLLALMEALAQGRGVEPMPGLVLRWQGSLKDCGDRELIADINALPYPDYSDFREDILSRRYANPSRLEIFDSRGCVRSCSFCSEWQFWRRYRTMTAERMLSEIRHQMALYPGVSHFYFIGSLLNGQGKNLERFCDQVLESGLKFTWEGQAIIQPAMDEPLLAKMAKAGCVWLGYGIESGSERLRRRVNKKFTNENALRTLEASFKAGIKTQINIMFGMPTETREEFGETLAFLRRARPYIDTVLASQSFCVLDKNTVFYNHPEEFGITGREHHLFWESNNGENNYPERFRRYEEFCRLALELGLPETSGVLRRKPDKYLLLGQYHQFRKQYVRAVREYRRSLLRESINPSLLLDLARCYKALERPRKAAAYLQAALSLTGGESEGSLAASLQEELKALSLPAEDAAVRLKAVQGEKWLARTIEGTAAAEHRIRDNFKLHTLERTGGFTRLASTPPHITLGTHNACNAKCPFCLEGNYSRFNLQMYKEFFEAKMGRFIRNAQTLTFTGFGEVLFIPGIEEFLDYLNATLPHTVKIFTTNGTPLTPGVIERILKSHYAIQVSLHASHASLHEKMTLLKGQFERVVDNIRALTAKRVELGLYGKLHVELINVLTRDNIQDLPDFLRLAWDLNVQKVRCFYMTMFTPDHIGMSCYFDQAQANAMLRRAQEVLADCKSRQPEKRFVAELPPLFGDETAFVRNVCPDPWRYIYVELEGSSQPCCFWGEHAANLKNGDQIDALWNGRFYRELRRGLANDDPHPWCRQCIRYTGFSVNNLLCHITNRPGQRQVVLDEIRRRGILAEPAAVGM